MKNSNMNKGQSLIEFGLSMIVILITIFGIFNIGRLFWVKIVITNSAREGARYLIGHPDDVETGWLSTKDAVVKEANNSGIQLAGGDVTIFCPDINPADNLCDPGTTASVKVTQKIDVGILDIFGISPVTLEETANMLVP